MNSRTTMVVGGMLLAIFVVLPLLSRRIWEGFTVMGMALFLALVAWMGLALVRGLRLTGKRRQLRAICTVDWASLAGAAPETRPATVIPDDEELRARWRKVT